MSFDAKGIGVNIAILASANVISNVVAVGRTIYAPSIELYLMRLTLGFTFLRVKVSFIRLETLTHIVERSLVSITLVALNSYLYFVALAGTRFPVKPQISLTVVAPVIDNITSEMRMTGNAKIIHEGMPRRADTLTIRVEGHLGRARYGAFPIGVHSIAFDAIAPFCPVIEDRVWLAFLAKSFRGPVEVILADAHTIDLQLL